MAASCELCGCVESAVCYWFGARLLEQAFTMATASTITVSRKSVPDRWRERRVYERFELDGAFGNLVSHGELLPCQFIDISLGGCCVRTEQPFSEGALAPVEIVLMIFGLILRIGGVTQWTSTGNLIGIRFAHPSTRSKNQLAGLLTCLIDKSAAESVKEAIAADHDLPGKPILVAQEQPGRPDVAVQSAVESVHPEPPKPHAESDSARTQLPVETEWPAVLRFLESRAHVQGLIVDLKPDGCTVKTSEPFPGSLHVRVELSFHMRGLPFQLAAVTVAFPDKHTTDIRFLDMSRRKREELGQVIEEIADAKKRAALEDAQM